MIQKWSYKVNVYEALYMFVLPVAVGELIAYLATERSFIK